MGDKIGGVIMVVALILILALLFSGFWAYCTVTDPEYLEEFYFR